MIAKFLNLLLDAVFPKSPVIVRLEKMSPQEFLALASPASSPKGIVALFEYRDPLVREAVWALKYRGNAAVALLMAKLFALKLKGRHGLENPLIIPIPLARRRLWERGFNQCERVALRLASELGGACEYRSDILRKVRATRPQTRTETRKKRLKNIRNCFAVSSAPAANGRNIILIDDVVTTGSTLSEGRRVLKDAGARKVLCLAFAH